MSKEIECIDNNLRFQTQVQNTIRKKYQNLWKK